MKVKACVYPTSRFDCLFVYLQNQEKGLLTKQMMIKKIQVNKSLIMKIFIDLSSIYIIETESDEVRHKPLPKTDNTSQMVRKQTFLMLIY